MSAKRAICWMAVVIHFITGIPAFAGNGKFDPSTGAFDFCVSLRFEATSAEKTKLKDLFFRASQILNGLTHGQHQFGDITVYNDSRAGKNADFWILDGKGSSFATPGEFGHSGRTIVLYYKSLIDSGKSGVDGAYIIAHAFAHHAYGLYDEYRGSNEAPAECLMGTSATHVCLMENYKTALKGGVLAKEWCVDSNHDSDKDTLQELVHHDSCWEVAKKRFPSLVVPTVFPYSGPELTLQNSAFHWTNGSTTRRFVEVIDRSGSMSGAPIELAKSAASIFACLVDSNDKLGVASFADLATEDFKLSTMDGAAKAAAKAAISGLVASGATNIGGGLQKALEMLTSTPGEGCVQAIILLSDGQHNTGINPSLVIPSIVAEGIPVYTIGLSNGVDAALMQSIALQTNGKFYATTDAGELVSIFAQIAAELSDGGVIASGANLVESSTLQQEKIYVDAKTSVATFVISWDVLDPKLILVLKGPGMSVTVDVLNGGISNPPLGATVTLEPGAVTIVVSETIAKFGTWNLTVSNKDTVLSNPPIHYRYQVLSNDSDILFSATPDKLAYQYPGVMTIGATVLYEAPISNVSMTGTVTRPDGSMVPFALDDSASLTSGDLFANDGNASHRFLGWNGNGIYIVEVDVHGDSSATTVIEETIDDKSPTIDVKTFNRHTEFAVSVSGVPSVDTTHYFVDKLKMHFEPIGPLLNKATLIGSLDLDSGLVDPATESLTISVNGVLHTIEPADLTKIDDNHFVFDISQPASSTQPYKYSGYVDLFLKGTSKGAVKLTSHGLPLSAPVVGADVSTALEWGEFDESLSVCPKITSGTDSNYKSNANPAKKNVFYVTSALVKLKGAPNQDRLSLRARYNFAYDPKAGITSLHFGSFTIQVPATAWTLVPGHPGQLQFTSLDTVTGKSLTIVVDTELREISLDGSGLELPEFPNPAIVEFQCAGFYQKTEITLAVGKKSLSY